MTKRHSSIVLAVALFGVVGCATTESMKGAPAKDGVMRVFEGQFEHVLRYAREAVIEAGLQIEEATKTDEDMWMLHGKKASSAWSWGELVRVSVEKQSESHTVVRVLTKRRLATNVTAKGDYSDAILSNIELKLITESEAATP